MIEFHPELMAQIASPGGLGVTVAPTQSFERLLAPADEASWLQASISGLVVDDSADAAESGPLPSLAMPHDNKGDARGGEEIRQSQSLAIQAGSILDPRAAPLTGDTAVIEAMLSTEGLPTTLLVLGGTITAAQGSADAAKPGPLPSLNIAVDDKGDAWGGEAIRRSQPLAFQAGSIIDPRAAPLIGGTAVIEATHSSAGLPTTPPVTGGTIAASLPSVSAKETSIAHRDVRGQAAQHSGLTGEKSAQIKQGSTRYYLPGEPPSASAMDAPAPIEPGVPDSIESVDRRGATSPAKTADEQRAASHSTSVRVDLRQDQQNLVINIAMPFLDAGAAPRLSRRVEEVLAAYDAMGARVMVNGSPLLRVASKGGAGHGGQRN